MKSMGQEEWEKLLSSFNDLLLLRRTGVLISGPTVGGSEMLITSFRISDAAPGLCGYLHTQVHTGTNTNKIKRNKRFNIHITFKHT